MSGYLKRLVSSLAAYQVADVVSKFLAVLLLPLYTRYIAPSGYGVVELLATGVILVSIVVRFGIIESFLRYYFVDDGSARRDALARRSTRFLLATSSLAAVALAVAAGPLSSVVLARRDSPTFLIAVLGLWSFTNLELAYGLLRVDERIATYAKATLANVLLTVAASVVLVVAAHQGVRGLLLGNYGASTLVLLALWWSMRRRLFGGERAAGTGRAADRMRALLGFGLPTMPAEISVYALSIIDRYYIFHTRSQGLAGLYSIAIKLAGSVAFIVRAFQYAWPPLAYSVQDDAEAGRLYGLVTTYYVLISGWAVAGLALLSRWVLKVLAAPAYFGAYRALPWVALGWAMYGLWVVFLVVAGRVGVTRRNFPASLAGLGANVVLLLLLVPAIGIAGAGVALCGAYLVMLTVMHALTRRAFSVQFEWRRVLHVVAVFAIGAAAGELLLPTHGVLGLLLRLAVFLLLPAVLFLTRFARPEEVRAARELPARLRAGRGWRRAPSVTETPR